ncbi:MAG: RNA polymerase factor sigma-54, partial [Proteobacteria bacterium]|nr:RNA polymerase factor sigma-54 [Pseudomonadota bacterium]
SLYLPGIAARDLRECLMLQLHGLDEKTAYVENAKKLVSNHLDRLGKHQYTALGQELEIDQSSLAKVIALIQSLNPKPGEELTPFVDQAISPDVVVKKVDQEWVVRLVRPDGSVIRISQDYRNYQNSSDKKTSEYIKNHLQDAQWFIRSLEQRDQTILKVTQTIVSMQRNFMESGDMGVVPMTLRDIANELDIHESTVSRAIDQKNILTPHGLFALKHFFSASLGGSDGSQTSARAAQAKIRKVIESESAQQPLSDNQLVAMLNQDGITIARRTVAKYREQMKILPAAQRRSIT